MTKPEGVAAPLEPSQIDFDQLAKEYVESRLINDWEKRLIGALLADFGKKCAAAVSKNLQKELDLVKRVLLQHLNDEDFEYSLVGLYTKLTENDDAGKSPR